MFYYQSCTEVPLISNQCSTVLSHIHYAPVTDIGNFSNDLIDEIRRINELPVFEVCKEIFGALHCAVKYPACNPSTNKLIPIICPSQCQAIDIHITQCSLDLLKSNFPLLKDILNTIDCDKPETYHPLPSQYIDTNSTKCLNLSKLK